MHELSIVQALCDQVKEVAISHGAQKVVRIVIEVGELSNVVPELLQTAFAVFREAEPLLENAEIESRRIPLKLLCQACGHEFHPALRRFRCPQCLSLQVKVLQGEELLLRDVELELVKEAHHV